MKCKLTFSNPVATAVFQICSYIECNTLITTSFRILNSLAGIPSPPLALFIVMLPETHLASHSRMSSSRCVTAAAAAAYTMVIQVIKTFEQFFCVFWPLLLNLFCFCYVHTISVPLLCPSLHEMFPSIKYFLGSFLFLFSF